EPLGSTTISGGGPRDAMGRAARDGNFVAVSNRWVLSRPMRDRRAVARYAGLTGSPDESGAQRREQGLARAGNARVRRGMIQLAWRFLMFNPLQAKRPGSRG